MPVYQKICSICQKKFYALKVNALYCSKKCSNRTRYLPKKLVESLIERNSKFGIKATKYVAMLSDAHGDTVGYDPGATLHNPLGKDEGLLIALAKHNLQMRKEQLEREQQEKKQSEQSESGFVITEKQNLPDPDSDIKDIEFEFAHVLGNRQEEKKTVRLSGFRNKK